MKNLNVPQIFALILKYKSKLFIFIYVYGALFARLSVCVIVCLFNACECQKRALDILELEVLMVV